MDRTSITWLILTLKGMEVFHVVSRRHNYKARDCPQRRPPGEAPTRNTSVVHSLPDSGRANEGEETLDDRCKHLREELESAELARMSEAYAEVSVDKVVGSVGPL